MIIRTSCYSVISFILFAGMQAFAATISYQGTGTVSQAHAETGYSVGNTFTISFDIDESAPVTSFSGSGDNFGFGDGVLNFLLEFDNGTLMSRPGGSDIDQAGDSVSGLYRFRPFDDAHLDSGFITTIRRFVDDPGGDALSLELYSFDFALASNSGDFAPDDLEMLRGFDPELIALSRSGIAFEWLSEDQESGVRLRGSINEFHVVPEPGTGTLVAFGLVLSGSLRRRRLNRR